MAELKLVPPTIAAVEAAVDRNRARNPLRVPPEAIRRSRIKRQAADQRTAREDVLLKLFDPAAPFPGVLPEGHEWKKPKLAMDAAPLQVVGWASQWGINSSLAEGQGFLGYAALSELAQRPEYRAISETMAYEMTREGIDLQSTGSERKTERIRRIEGAFDRLRVLEVLRKAALHDGFFGRGHIYLEIGDASDERDELATSIGTGTDEASRAKVSPQNPLRRLVNVEPVWTYPATYDSVNPLKPDWFKPQSWFVMANRVHDSRLLTFVGREVPDLLKPAYSFGGLSLSQMAMPYVQNWLRTRQAVADLIWSYTVFVLKTNLSESMQGDGEQLFVRAELFNNTRSNQGLMMLDKDLEDFVNVQASIAGLHELQAQAQEHMSSVSRIPLVKLLGIQPTGLNASSEGEIRVFYDWVHAYQEHLFRKNLDRILAFVQLSEFGDVDPEVTYEFKGLWQLDEAGEVAVLKTKADIDDANIAMGKITAEEARRREASDEEGIYQGIDLSEPLPEPDPFEEPSEEEPGSGMEQGASGPEKVFGRVPGEVNLPKPKDPSNRLATSITTKAANFGGSASGGFGKDGPIPDKVLPSSVGYEVPARKRNQRCALCAHFETPDACERVSGSISPDAWCELFEAAP